MVIFDKVTSSWVTSMRTQSVRHKRGWILRGLPFEVLLQLMESIQGGGSWLHAPILEPWTWCSWLQRRSWSSSQEPSTVGWRWLSEGQALKIILLLQTQHTLSSSTLPSSPIPWPPSPSQVGAFCCGATAAAFMGTTDPLFQKIWAKMQAIMMMMALRQIPTMTKWWSW